MENSEQFLSIYTVRGFLEVDDANDSCVMSCALVGYVTYVRVSLKV